MKKKIAKRIIFIVCGAIFLFVVCFLFFKRDFDSLVEKQAKALNTYTINVKLDNDSNVISAVQTMEINNNYQGVDALYFHLYPRAFRQQAQIKPYTVLNQGKCFSNGESFGSLDIEKVIIEGESRKVQYAGEDENVLKIDYSFDNETVIDIQLEYTVTIPNCNHRFGYMDGNINLGNWYPILAYFDGEKFDLTPYYSTGDPFVSEMANYNITFEYPKELICATTGNIINESVSDYKQINIEAKAVRDFALVFSDKFELQEVDLKNTTIKYYGYEGDEDVEYLATLIKDGVEFFNAKFGEYPYRQISVVKTPFIYGGMEYPNMVMIADNITQNEDKLRVIIHELAHQWWYGVVGNNEISEAWLDESLTEYSALLFFDNYPSYSLKYSELLEDAVNTYELYVDVITSLGGTVNYSMIDRVDKYASEYEYSYMVYVKGIIMYDDIKKTVGDKNFYKALQKYYKNYRFKIASGEDLIGCFEKTSKTNVRDKFNFYLKG